MLSVPVEYLRWDGERLQVMASLGRTHFEVETEYGATEHVFSRDFLISAKDLQKDPKKGDKIYYDGVEYEVLAPQKENVWRWSGTSHLTRRIHTKEIETYER